jgi:fatty-acyl-CoA synthase
MLGAMQDWPLLCHKIIDHAAACHSSREVVTRSIEGPIHRTNYEEIRNRARKVAQRLDREGIGVGDRVATLALNTWRHLEVCYGTTGIGAIHHTVNPRLFPEQIAWIINHAQDLVMFVDAAFVPLLESLADRLPSIKRYIILTDEEHLPQTVLKGAVAYEPWIAESSGDFSWCSLDENTAAGLCYTSGTTGHPKGVLYSHRSTVLHSLMVAQADIIGLKASDSVLPVVPFYHANGWGLPFHAPMVGARLVLPGARLDAPSLFELLRDEKVTYTAGVPTVWLSLQQYMEQNTLRLPYLKRLAVGGAAPSPAMITAFEGMGIPVTQGWGMTEMGPIGANGMLKPPFEALAPRERLERLSHQGVAPFLVEMKITDETGKELARDGRTPGKLKVRGPSVVQNYFNSTEVVLDDGGHFDTGDIATIDEHGYMRITDRAKDIIKSGGEWISSVELENVAMGHPAVFEAAVIGVPHPKWDERPLLIVQLRGGTDFDGKLILEYLQNKVAKWWIPDDVIIVDAIPHTATGKIRKTELRERYGRRLSRDS